jgi:hypothetical protein
MKSVQIIKKVNNTELGKAATHETYVLVPQELNVSDLFEELEKKYKFVDKCTNKTYELRLTSGREKRIVGLGPFYRDHDVFAGDEMLFEKRTSTSGEHEYFVSVKKFHNIVVFQKKKNAFAVLTPERLGSLLNREFEDFQGKKFKISFLGEFKMREDSPELTKLYDVLLDGKNLAGDYSNNQMFEIVSNDACVEMRSFRPWKKYVIEVGN